MCLILLAYDNHPDYFLVVAANRDEYYSRPTAGARFWDEAPALLAGKDLEHRGTWLGITRSGRFAALTNFRDPVSYRSNAGSRGMLVRDYLFSSGKSAEYLNNLQGVKGWYNGFNLVLMEGEELWFCSSRAKRPERMGPGIYGISNHLPDTPWPKVVKGKEWMWRVLAGDGAYLAEGLLDLLSDDGPARDEELPRTGVSLEWERLLSPIFIRGETYGTRASTVLLIDRRGRVNFYERSFGANGRRLGKDAVYQFALDKALI
ncbi:MAG: hypothetical protein VR68_15445 [Peptococcaceae bacterium BRH_c4a]|nr:MAG: hypothetical protein VR68_15445 [Peptococcaceae bacterium BRH_c4a]